MAFTEAGGAIEPGLRWKRLGEPGPRSTFMVVFQPGDGLGGIGSFSSAAVSFFEPEK